MASSTALVAQECVASALDRLSDRDKKPVSTVCAGSTDENNPVDCFCTPWRRPNGASRQLLTNVGFNASAIDCARLSLPFARISEQSCSIASPGMRSWGHKRRAIAMPPQPSRHPAADLPPTVAHPSAGGNRRRDARSDASL